MHREVSRLTYTRTAARMAWAAFREGRLSPSPRRWMVDLRHLWGVLTVEASVQTSPPPHPSSAISHKDVIASMYRAQLAGFLASGARLRFDSGGAPRVSVLLVLFNRSELTLRCLRALCEQAVDTRLELIVVDNASTDDTDLLLHRIDGAHVIRPGSNLGFVEGCNLAARSARGEYLLFLNNDAEILPDSLATAVAALDAAPGLGAVGGKLVLPDGSLQEAGSIVWSDGSCLGYGRGHSPWAPEYAFSRDVDYCSAALLLTPRHVFLTMGGFDGRFAPAYYEDVDYCVRLWKAGYRVQFHPRLLAMHFEFASSGSLERAIQMQAERRQRFVAKHHRWLAQQSEPLPHTPLRARARDGSGLRVLVFDDRVPHSSTGFGFPRAVELIRALVDLGHFVTLYPTSVLREPWPEVYEELPSGVEVMLGYGPARVEQFMDDRRGYYDRIIVSRPHNAELLRAKLGMPQHWGVPTIFDAEAICSVRDLARRRLTGEQVDEATEREMVRREIALAEGMSAVLCVSALEARAFADGGARGVHVLTHAISPTPTCAPFELRDSILFVGAFHELSPNADSVVWFVREVLPRINAAVGRDVRFLIAGPDPPPDVRSLAGGAIEVLGAVADLAPLYETARLFVAPTRFSAGIPLKVIHASAHGVPVVASPLLAHQLNWRNGRELLTGESREELAAACASIYMDGTRWLQIRREALRRVEADYSRANFIASVDAVLRDRTRS
jgi:O-antigen biosynthesis protein